MIAARHGKEIHISPDMVKAFAGVTSGYRVEMHDPVIRCHLIVDAPTADDAHRAAVSLCQRQAIGFRLTGATITRIGA